MPEIYIRAKNPRLEILPTLRQETQYQAVQEARLYVYEIANRV